MNALESRTLEALLRAVALYQQPLPQDLQQAIRRIGHDLENHDTQALQNISTLVQQDNALKRQYDYVYKNLQKQLISQERTRALETTANQVFYADDMIESAQEFLDRLDNQSTETSQKIDFWERGNRVVALATGGAFLGVLLAQLPGAIIGGVLVALYAWFSAPYVNSSGDA